MDEDEFRELDLKLRRREFRQRERHHKDQRRSVILTGLGVVITVLISAVTIWRQGGQFEATLRANEYNEIVSGLASDAVAVQDSSMRRLVSYVQDSDNFDSEEEREAAYHTAMHTLTAFIVDESDKSRATGLGAYQNPQPIIVPRAMNHLRTLAEDEMGAVAIDIARADLHGAFSWNGFAPRATVYAVGIDLRRADLSGLNLEANGSGSNLKSAFLTCASLAHAKLGKAALDGADLTGANLKDADLSGVTGLTEEQLTGAGIGPRTRLPDDLELEPQDSWREADASRCYDMVNAMTGMRGSQGYWSELPCPESNADAKSMEVDPPWEGELTGLVEACRLRAGKVDQGLTQGPAPNSPARRD